MNKFAKSIGCLLAAGAAYGAWWMGMNYTGYCHAEGRYLSDQEKFDSAIQYVLDRYPPTISKTVVVDVNGTKQTREHWYMPENIIRYNGIDDFKKNNQDCCKLSKTAGEGRRHSILDRLTGNASGFVIINYKVMYIENSFKNHAMDVTAVTVKNCGTSWSGL